MGFYQGLEDNIRAASQAALIKSVVCDATQTIGNIITALEGEEDAKYLLEAFKDLTVGQIVHAALEEMQSLGEIEVAANTHPPAQEQGEEEEAAPPKKVRVPNANKKSPPRKAAKPKSNGDIDLSHPDSRKAYESSILKALKAGKHVDEESGVTSQSLRKVVGGEALQAREILDELIQNGRVAYYGKARGMRYYLFA